MATNKAEDILAAIILENQKLGEELKQALHDAKHDREMAAQANADLLRDQHKQFQLLRDQTAQTLSDAQFTIAEHDKRMIQQGEKISLVV